jgi:hypothetical protein
MADDEKTETEESTDQTDQTDQSEKSEAETGESVEGGENVERSENDDPEFGKKDDEPANEVQMKYLKPLAEDLDEDIPDDMSEADASEMINDMQDNAAG